MEEKFSKKMEIMKKKSRNVRNENLNKSTKTKVDNINSRQDQKY
jgi:hypothetical protein